MLTGRWGVTVVALWGILHAAALAQVTSADVVGRVTDSSAAVLPGVTVTITHLGTQDSRTTTTNQSGDYVSHEGLPNSLASGTRPDDRRQTSAVSINGALDNQNNQMIDGIDNNERSIGTIGVKPSIDAIAELKVQTNLYTAEVGRTAGGVVNIITKSGTNELHGSAFKFYRNDKFDARNFFATPTQILMFGTAGCCSSTTSSRGGSRSQVG